jgi:hypothetical protein
MSQIVSITAIASGGVALKVAKVVGIPVQGMTLETVSNVYPLGTAVTKVTYSSPNLKAPVTYETTTAIATIITAANS